MTVSYMVAMKDLLNNQVKNPQINQQEEWLGEGAEEEDQVSKDLDRD